MLTKLEKEVIKGICDYQNFNTSDEVKEVIRAIKELDVESEDDFYVECNGVEIRVIAESAVDEIWEDGLLNLLEECYTIPDFLTNYIDYDKWVQDCKYDGKGHHFSSYDGSEHETKHYYYFRTN
jgi:hypothetical protein